MVNHYYFEMFGQVLTTREEYESGLSVSEFSPKPPVFAHGDYYANMKPYFDLFPRERIHVSFYDHLKDDPRGFVQELYRFLGRPLPDAWRRTAGCNE